MVQVTPFLLVLSLALVAPGFSERQCMLNGHWINNKGHTLAIGSPDQQGMFKGRYIIDRAYPLKGSQRGVYFNFTVDWSSDKKTVFTGQCFGNNGEKEVLKTTWVLMAYVNNQCVVIRRGTDDFTRLCSCREGGIVGDFNADGSTWDADPLSCTKMGQHSQEKFGSAGDFKTDGSAWDADPISGSTTCF